MRWRKDSFAPDGVDSFGRHQEMLSSETASPQLLVDALASATMIAELANGSIASVVTK